MSARSGALISEPTTPPIHSTVWTCIVSSGFNITGWIPVGSPTSSAITSLSAMTQRCESSSIRCGGPIGSGNPASASVRIPGPCRARRTSAAPPFAVRLQRDAGEGARDADGRDIIAFKRFGGRETPSASSFSLQVAAGTLDELQERRGAVILYQHFGVNSLRGRKKSKQPGASGRSQAAGAGRTRRRALARYRSSI